MKHIKIIDLEYEVEKMCRIINAPRHLLPDFGSEESQANDSQPLIIYRNGKYVFLVYERGKKIEEKETIYKDEIVFWIFEGITHSLGFEYAAKRCEGEQRVCAFREQIRLLKHVGVKKDFINKLKEKYNELVGVRIFEI